jgi:hypothetical protein
MVVADVPFSFHCLFIFHLMSNLIAFFQGKRYPPLFCTTRHTTSRRQLNKSKKIVTCVWCVFTIWSLLPRAPPTSDAREITTIKLTICFDNIRHEILFGVLLDVIWLWRSALCRTMDFVHYESIFWLQKLCCLLYNSQPSETYTSYFTVARYAHLPFITCINGCSTWDSLQIAD